VPFGAAYLFKVVFAIGAVFPFGAVFLPGRGYPLGSKMAGGVLEAVCDELDCRGFLLFDDIVLSRFRIRHEGPDSSFYRATGAFEEVLDTVIRVRTGY